MPEPKPDRPQVLADISSPTASRPAVVAGEKLRGAEKMARIPVKIAPTRRKSDCPNRNGFAPSFPARRKCCG